MFLFTGNVGGDLDLSNLLRWASSLQPNVCFFNSGKNPFDSKVRMWCALNSFPYLCVESENTDAMEDSLAFLCEKALFFLSGDVKPLSLSHIESQRKPYTLIRRVQGANIFTGPLCNRELFGLFEMRHPPRILPSQQDEDEIESTDIPGAQTEEANRKKKRLFSLDVRKSPHKKRLRRLKDNNKI